MLINKLLIKLAKNCSSLKNIRPTLYSLFIKDNKAMATNSFKLCEIEYKQNIIEWEKIINKDDIILDADIDLLPTMKWEHLKYKDLFITNSIWEVHINVKYLKQLLEVYETWKIETIKLIFADRILQLEWENIDYKIKSILMWRND